MIAFGDRALLFAAPEDVRERRALLDALRTLHGVVDAVVAEEQAMVVLDVPADRAGVERTIAGLRVDAADVVTKEHFVETSYDGEDLDDVARAAGMSKSAVVDAHAAREYVASFVGFLPGFAYLRGLDERLVLPRRATPRARVPARSVAVAAKYTGIYPDASPGGWHLLGRTAFDPRGRIALADRVRFVPVAALAGVDPPPPSPPLEEGPDEVVAVNGLAVVVGPPRHGRMHEGVAPGGPLVESALAELGAARAIEVHGSIAVTTARGKIVVASGRDARCAYLALEGDLREGTRIRRGDRITAGESLVPVRTSEVVSVRVGPEDIGREAHETLFASTFTIASTSNRVGTRLDGPAFPTVRADRASSPMIRGAIEVTPAGLVVLGPDHPTTGGYPVIAVVCDHAMDAFCTLPFNASVRFAPA